MSRIDGQDRCRDFAKYDGVRIASDLLKNYKKKELVERAVLRLLRVAATNGTDRVCPSYMCATSRARQHSR